jgi:hypothetical protein
MSDIALSPRAPSQVFSLPWIFGPRTDLAVSIGGMLAGFSLFFLFTTLGLSVLLVWFVWVIVLDTPHFFASYFRTYLDKEERQNSRALLIGTLAVFLIVPAVLILCGALYVAGVPRFRLPWNMFFSFVGVWAYYHVVRQHYGIMRLYNRKGGEFGTAEARLDAIMLYGALGLAFLGAVTGFNPIRRRIGLGSWPVVTDSFWSSPLDALSRLQIDQMAFYAAGFGVALLVARYAVFQAGKFMRGEPINLPKVVFIATVIFLHSFMAFSGLMPTTSVLAFTAVVTIYHDIQYFVVVWFYARNRYRKSPAPWRQYGLAGVLAKSFPLFLVAGIVTVSLPVWGASCLLNRVPVCATGAPFGPPTFMGQTAWILLFAWFTSGVQMHHYVLDQFIWRPSRSAQLRKQLKLES